MGISESGIYLLILELIRPISLEVRSGRVFILDKGYYGYIGSALNGLHRRINRHLSRKKRLFWHIDYLLETATVKCFIVARSDKRSECLIAQSLIEKHRYIRDFGCSDCRCQSHLFYNDDIEVLTNNAAAAFELHKLKPIIRYCGE